MRLLLTTLNAKYIHTNLAIRLLYSLNKTHEGLAWQEFTIKESPEEIARYCGDFQIVAFSCYIWNISQTLIVAQTIKAHYPQVKILLGGPEVSYEWQDIIALPYVDFIIVGEGEVPFQAFLEQYPQLDQVPSLVRKDDKGIHYNPKVVAFDLQAYEEIMPYADDPVESLHSKVLYVETSRGCPYKCEFCLASLDNKVRYLPDKHIKSTLLHLMQHGRTIKFLDRTFNIKRDFTLDIFRFILAHYRQGNIFQFEITADIIHPDIIRFIQDTVPVGLFRFEIGIQTVNQKANRAVSRKQNFDKTSQVVRALSDYVEMHLDLIVGLALDYWADVRYSFEQVFLLFPPELQLGFLKFLKGTPVRDKYQEHGFVFDPNPPYQIIESNYLSKEELHKVTQLEHALEIYWNKKRAPNTLQYIALRYSIFDFLLGLGIYFGTRSLYHRYSLEEAFDILLQHTRQALSDDPLAAIFVALDYYLYAKTRPQVWAWAELDKATNNRLVELLRLNKQTHRYVFIALSFDFSEWHKTATIQPADQLLLIRYDAQAKARWEVLPMATEIHEAMGIRLSNEK